MRGGQRQKGGRGGGSVDCAAEKHQCITNTSIGQTTQLNSWLAMLKGRRQNSSVGNCKILQKFANLGN